LASVVVLVFTGAVALRLAVIRVFAFIRAVVVGAPGGTASQIPHNRSTTSGIFLKHCDADH